MRIGVRCSEGGDSFEATARQAELAESLGFDSLWLGEHHGWPDDFWPSPQVALAAVAERTDSITLGTCLSILPLARPVRLAGEANLLDVISGGRAILGVGVGWRPDEFEALGVEFGNRGPRTTESLRALRRLWADDPASFDGDTVSFEEVSLSPPSLQQPRPPVFVGGLADPTLKRAARLCDAWFPAWMPSLSTLEERRAQYVEFLEEAGEDPAERTQPLLRLAWVDESPDAAMAQLESIVEGIVTAYQAVGYTPLSDDALAAFRESVREFAADRFIVGTPETCAREIERYRDEVSVDHLVLKIGNPGMDPETVTDGIQRFGTEVLPLVD